MWDDEIRRRLRSARLDPPKEAEVVREIAQHLDDRYRELRDSGVEHDDAARIAIEEITDASLAANLSGIGMPPPGSGAVLGEPARRSWLADAAQDVRYACRILAASRGFTATAVLTLALGTGATTAVFSIVDAALLRPLPFDAPESLVRLFEDGGSSPSFPSYVDWKTRARSFERLAAFRLDQMTLEDSASTERILVCLTTADIFQLFRVRAAAGRLLTEADQLSGARPVALITHAYWTRRFGRDPGAVGRALPFLEGSRVIVGVLPQEFRFRSTIDVWLPLSPAPLISNRAARMFSVVARLKPDVSPGAAQLEMDALARVLAEEHGSDARSGVSVVPLHDLTVRRIRPTLLLLLGTVACVLLVACVNVTGLLIARGASRRQEIAVRVSLGASRGRILRQLLAESAVLSIVSAAVGAAIAWLVLAALVAALPVRLPPEVAPAVDLRVLACVLSAGMMTGIGVGLAPALRAIRTNGTGVSAREPRSTAAGRRRVGHSLVLVEIAVSLILLAGAGLMIRSLHRLLSETPGFDPNGAAALIASPVVRGEGAWQRTHAYYDAVLERLMRTPGVLAAGAIDSLPFSGTNYTTVASVDGIAGDHSVSPRWATPGYFRALGVRITLGRDFDDRDRPGAPAVAIVNQTAARRLWDGDPIGRRIRFGNEPIWREVVGVVSDARHTGLGDDVSPEVYAAYAQQQQSRAGRMMIVVRAPRDVTDILPALRIAANGAGERAVIERIAGLGEMIGESTIDLRNRTILLSILGGLGGILAAVGIFGLTAYSVARRQREIGVRVALGATPVRLIGDEVAGLVPALAAGVVAGLGGAALATRVLESFLYGITATDPSTFGLAALGVVTLALAAAYIPARRTLQVDPVIALRSE